MSKKKETFLLWVFFSDGHKDDVGAFTRAEARAQMASITKHGYRVFKKDEEWNYTPAGIVKFSLEELMDVTPKKAPRKVKKTSK